MYASTPLNTTGTPMKTVGGAMNDAALSAAQNELVKRIARTEQDLRRAQTGTDTALVSKLTLQIIAMEKALAEITNKTGKAPPAGTTPSAALQPGQSVADPAMPNGINTMDQNGTLQASAAPLSAWEQNKKWILGGALAFGLFFAVKKFK